MGGAGNVNVNYSEGTRRATKALGQKRAPAGLKQPAKFSPSHSSGVRRNLGRLI